MSPRRRPSHRIIEGLREATPCPRPAHIPHSRPRGVKAVGLRYERAVAKAIPGAIHNQWFSFVDKNGHGHCCPDIILDLGRGIVVLECKLTDVDEARSQLEWLYKPVLARAYNKPVRGIVVTRHLTRLTNVTNVVDSLGAALLAPFGSLPTLHWLGRGPL